MGADDLPAVVLLHGSGQDETSLLELARRACPGRTLVAVRGRIPWEDGFAFFRRHPDRSLDDDDLARGAEALQRLLRRLQRGVQRPPVLLGFSNGAIAAAAVLALDHQVASATGCSDHCPRGLSRRSSSSAATRCSWSAPRTTSGATRVTRPGSLSSWSSRARG